jgi:hypothetical protein
MKTTNSAQKTENKPFGKSAILTLTLVLSLVLLGITTSASPFGKHFPFDNSKAHKAHLMGTPLAMGHLHIPAAHPGEAFLTANAFAVETSAEKNLEIESWMTNEKYFASPLPSFEAEMEESLMVEAWMLASENFFESTITEESDKALNVEKWMLDASIWVN